MKKNSRRSSKRGMQFWIPKLLQSNLLLLLLHVLYVWWIMRCWKRLKRLRVTERVDDRLSSTVRASNVKALSYGNMSLWWGWDERGWRRVQRDRERERVMWLLVSVIVNSQSTQWLERVVNIYELDWVTKFSHSSLTKVTLHSYRFSPFKHLRYNISQTSVLSHIPFPLQLSL